MISGASFFRFATRFRAGAVDDAAGFADVAASVVTGGQFKTFNYSHGGKY